jgi:N-acetylglucosamine-6-sulfatase
MKFASPASKVVIAVLALGAALLLAHALPGGSTETAGAQTAPAAKPNVIVLFTDDQESRSMRVMKIVAKKLKRNGVTMKHYYDNFPLCCPARSTLFTGQYAHNHHVISNVPPDGGYGVFNDLHGDNYLPIWLQAAGYQTSYIGKFENGYAEPDAYGTTPTDVPKGWNDWHVLAPSRAQYFNYTLNQNGNLRRYTDAPEDYSTDVFTKKARNFIRANARTRAPFYLELGYAAPHGGGGGDPGRSCNRAAVPAPQDLGTLKHKFKGILPPSFNEADVSDKPTPIATHPPLTPGQISDTLRKRRCAWESLLAVDRSVGSITHELERDGIDQNTYIFFLSDNGFMRGEHRIRDNKRFLYEESARVPFVAVGPGIPKGESSSDIVVNADLNPTIMQITGATPGLPSDGMSLLPNLFDPKLERGRAILLEAYAGSPILGVHTNRYVYTEWSDGDSTDGGPYTPAPERELYDMYADPYQLDNRAADPAYAGVVDELSNELEDLVKCAGDSCRQTPSGNFTFANGGVGADGCMVPPVTASFTSTSDISSIVGVSFRASGQLVGTDTEAPYEAPIPDAAIRASEPKRASVLAEVLYTDGRRLTLPAKIRLCS